MDANTTMPMHQHIYHLINAYLRLNFVQQDAPKAPHKDAPEGRRMLLAECHRRIGELETGLSPILITQVRRRYLRVNP